MDKIKIPWGTEFQVSVDGENELVAKFIKFKMEVLSKKIHIKLMGKLLIITFPPTLDSLTRERIEKILKSTTFTIN